MVDAELQSYLRSFESLKDANVGYRSEMAGALQPYLVVIHGHVSLYGQIHQYETEIDLRDLGSGADLEKLAALLIKSFEKAANKEGALAH